MRACARVGNDIRDLRGIALVENSKMTAAKRAIRPGRLPPADTTPITSDSAIPTITIGKK
jgi:hypothetical protein